MAQEFHQEARGRGKEEGGGGKGNGESGYGLEGREGGGGQVGKEAVSSLHDGLHEVFLFTICLEAQVLGHLLQLPVLHGLKRSLVHLAADSSRT